MITVHIDVDFPGSRNVSLRFEMANDAAPLVRDLLRRGLQMALMVDKGRGLFEFPKDTTATAWPPDKPIGAPS